MTSIDTAMSATASGAAGRIGGKSADGPEAGGSLFATLLALLDQPLSGEGESAGIAGRPFFPGQPLPGLAERDPEELLAELLSALEELAAGLAGDEPVPAAVIEAATAALAAAGAAVDTGDGAPGSLSGTLIGELTALLAGLRGDAADLPAANTSRLGAELARLAGELEADQPDLAQRLAELGRQFRAAADLAPPGAEPRLAAPALDAELPLAPARDAGPAQLAAAASGAAAGKTGMVSALAIAAAGAGHGAQNKSFAPPVPAAAAPAAADLPPGDTLFALPAGSTAGTATAAAPATTTAYGQPQINLPAVAFEIARQFNAGVQRFQIMLDPPELGRIDVKLDIDGSRVNARLSVERPETLDLLQRDARALERALAQAGLDGARTSLEFTLRQNPFAGGDGRHAAGGGDGSLPAPEADPAPEAAAAEITRLYYRAGAGPGGVDLTV